jgi:hypothetical protein
MAVPLGPGKAETIAVIAQSGKAVPPAQPSNILTVVRFQVPTATSIVWYKLTDVSDVLTASIIRALHTAKHSKRQPSSHILTVPSFSVY